MSSRVLEAIRESVEDESIHGVVHVRYARWWRRALRWLPPLCLAVMLAAEAPGALWIFLGASLVSGVADREFLLGLRTDSAVAFDRRSRSMSVGPDYFEIECGDVQPLSDRAATFLRPTSWRVLDTVVLANSAADETLRAWRAPRP